MDDLKIKHSKPGMKSEKMPPKEKIKLLDLVENKLKMNINNGFTKNESPLSTDNGIQNNIQ